MINHKLQRNDNQISKKKRNKVFKRDNYQCKLCGTTKNLTVDHIKPRANGGTNDLNNLQTLCCSCNIKKGIEEKDYTDFKRPLINKD
ncbi:HNH endonuclease [Methanobrevibacter sp. TMH8]|uniref:HNH endonuclease n=1 Tax=Methanobrevibacter sp. TMH8 TaxID=2848611 RepID=UPI003183042E|nr:HNH endonuclease [Methanobrevibacter sp. TMH8]